MELKTINRNQNYLINTQIDYFQVY